MYFNQSKVVTITFASVTQFLKRVTLFTYHWMWLIFLEKQFLRVTWIFLFQVLI